MRRWWMLAMVLMVVSCRAPAGTGLDGAGCTEIGCYSGVTFAVSGVGLDASGGRVVAEICVDGDCERARYRQRPDGSARWNNPRVDMSVSEDRVEVTFHLDGEDYDEATAHDVSLWLRVDGGDPISLQREVHLERSQPNGPNCPPVCWQARIEHAA
ncbi:MAG TPA: hypothetical protein VM307_08615 [Egibacteraceae bacterium]|nr:hypothetical protein [Egibacteraceae bacterium]